MATMPLFGTDLAGQLTTAEKVRSYMLAGKATITIRSKRTQTRFTYKITKLKDDAKSVWFVSLLRGPSNEEDYQYMGIIKPSAKSFEFLRTAKSRVTDAAESMVAFKWMMKHLLVDSLPNTLEVWHEGTCGRCGRKLTVPESVERGIGPECATKM